MVSYIKGLVVENFAIFKRLPSNENNLKVVRNYQMKKKEMRDIQMLNFK